MECVRGRARYIKREKRIVLIRICFPRNARVLLDVTRLLTVKAAVFSLLVNARSYLLGRAMHGPRCFKKIKVNAHLLNALNKKRIRQMREPPPRIDPKNYSHV